MAPVISPKKSWEGFAGSALSCVVVGWLTVAYLLDGDWWVGVLLGLIAVVMATLGDLCESVIKRDLGIKDMSPDHPRPRRPDGPARLAARHGGPDLAAAPLPGRSSDASRVSEPVKTLPLVFDEPRGRRQAAAPPRRPHRRRAQGAASPALGLPGFRAKQLSTHYFSRLVDDPAQMTDLPAAEREQLVEPAAAALMTPLRTLEADRGTTRKTLWRLFDGALVESVLMRYPDRVTMCVSSPGRLRDGLPVLRHRPGRPAAQHVHRRDRRAGRRRRPVARARRGARRARAGSPTWSSWAWASRWPTTRP